MLYKAKISLELNGQKLESEYYVEDPYTELDLQKEVDRMADYLSDNYINRNDKGDNTFLSEFIII